MKAPKTIIYLIGLYCVISGIIFTVISIISISSFYCAFDFTGSPLTYMIYLIYFRRNSCHKKVDWHALGITGTTAIDQPNMPPETSAVLRTLAFSITYLVLNLSLIVSAFRAMSGVNETSKNRHLLFWSYFSSLFIIFIAIIVLDFICSAFYLVEFFLIFFTSDHLLNLLEITNKGEVAEFFEQLSSEMRSLPSMIFFLVSSKFVLILPLNLASMYSLLTAVWKVCRDNQNHVFNVHEASKKRPSSAIMSINTIDTIYDKPATLVKSTTPERPQTSPPEPKPRANSIQSQSETFSATLEISIDDTKSLSSTASMDAIELPDIRDISIPRVSYEQSSFRYRPQSDYEDVRNRGTPF